MNKDAPSVQHRSTAVCANLLVAQLFAVALLTPSACAKRHALPVDELFRRIQVHEASIVDAQLAVRRATSCREAHAPAEEGVCDPSIALCALTESSDNRDAKQRCLMASDSCRAARERARALCASTESVGVRDAGPQS